MIRGLIGKWDDASKSYDHNAVYSEWFDIMQTALMPLVCFQCFWLANAIKKRSLSTKESPPKMDM